MLRIALGVVLGFLAWGLLWFGGEAVLSAVWPEFGVHQAAFQAAIETGGGFTAEPAILIVHIVLALIASVISGFMAALIAGQTSRAPLVLGLLLLAMGLLKAAMSWQLVPVWYHVTFTAVLFLMTIIGGKLKTRAEG